MAARGLGYLGEVDAGVLPGIRHHLAPRADDQGVPVPRQLAVRPLAALRRRHLSQEPEQPMPNVPPTAPLFGKSRHSQGGDTEGMVQLTVDEQAAVRRDPRPVKLELMAAVERDPKR
jgi:hypothetical protein